MTVDIILAIGVGTHSIAMAVLGGFIATERKIVRLSFVAMGLLSLIFVGFQAVRTAKSQDALTKEVEKVNEQAGDLKRADVELTKAQAELHDLETGGEAFPSVSAWLHFGENGEPEFATFDITNRNATRSLYAVTGHVIHSRGNELFLEGRDEFVFSEIAPVQTVKIPGEWKINGSEDMFNLNITARNGQFEATLARDGATWFCTVKRKDSSLILDRIASSEIRPAR